MPGFATIALYKSSINQPYSLFKCAIILEQICMYFMSFKPVADIPYVLQGLCIEERC